MPKKETLLWGAVGLFAGYYFVKHYHASGGRVI
jgi:hypothetical protein